MIDFHSHILPGIDDGSHSVEESFEMIKKMIGQNIHSAVATPHFYPEYNTPERFLRKREKSLNMLKSYLEENEISDFSLYLGAEFRYFRDMAYCEELPDLCISGTKTLLIEPTFTHFDNHFYDDIKLLISNGYKVIIAHFERYEAFNKRTNYLEDLIDLGVYIQSNSSYFHKGFFGRKAFNLVKNEKIHILGSDCHNMTTRTPDLGKSMDLIKSKLGESALDYMNNHEKRLLENATKITF